MKDKNMQENLQENIELTQTSSLQTTWGDLYLKFSSEDEANVVLQNYEGSIDIIGSIEGIVGWHVNTRGLITPILESFAVTVNTPMRVWA